MSARKMAKIAILSALCVAFRYAFSFLPNVQPISAIFFLIVIFEDLPTSLLVMAVTMFTSAFLLGMSPIVLFQLLSFGLILCLWRLLYPRLNLVGQGIVAALLSFGYGIAIDTLTALLYNYHWWSYAIINALTFNIAHGLSTLFFYPLLYPILRRLYNEKIFSLLTLAFALLLVGCGSSQTNTDKSSSSADSSVKKELKISISIAPEGQEKSEKTVAVEEGKTAMDALKKAYKVEEKDGFITSIDGHAQDEAKGLYWMFKVNGEMAPKAANQITVKDGDKLEFYQEVYQQ